MSIDAALYVRGLLGSGATWASLFSGSGHQSHGHGHVHAFDSGTPFEHTFIYGYEDGNPLPAMYVSSTVSRTTQIGAGNWSCGGELLVAVDLPSSGAPFENEYVEAHDVMDGLVAELHAQQRLDVRATSVEVTLTPFSSSNPDEAAIPDSGPTPQTAPCDYWQGAITVVWGTGT